MSKTKLKFGDKYIEVDDEFSDDMIERFEKTDDLEKTQELDLDKGENNESNK